jgi:hypothetical protein
MGGLLVALTMTAKLQDCVCPQVSNAVAMTKFEPMGKVLPLGGLTKRFGVLHPPVAVTVKKTVAPLGLVALVTMLFDGHWIASG